MEPGHPFFHWTLFFPRRRVVSVTSNWVSFWSLHPSRRLYSEPHPQFGRVMKRSTCPYVSGEVSSRPAFSRLYAIVFCDFSQFVRSWSGHEWRDHIETTHVVDECSTNVVHYLIPVNYPVSSVRPRRACVDRLIPATVAPTGASPLSALNLGPSVPVSHRALREHGTV
jgi:hypothetical protein